MNEHSAETPGHDSNERHNMSDFLRDPDPRMAEWLNELRRREARGEVRVQWHRAKEPYCIHSETGFRQPASACRYCKDKEYAEWVAYWRSLGAPE